MSKQSLYTGKSVQLAVMAEFVSRGYNVAVPEVDIVQVKTANAKELKRGGFSATFSASLSQIETPQTPDMHYVLVVRREQRWAEFIVITRKQVYRLHVNHKLGSVQNRNVVFSLSFSPQNVLLGSHELSSLRRRDLDVAVRPPAMDGQRLFRWIDTPCWLLGLLARCDRERHRRARTAKRKRSASRSGGIQERGRSGPEGTCDAASRARLISKDEYLGLERERETKHDEHRHRGQAQACRGCVVAMDISSIPPELREESGALFDDTRLDDIDPDKHAPFVIARVLDRGTIRSVAALLRFYGLERVRDFFRRGGARQLSCRTLPLWRAFLNLSREECTLESSPQSRSPFWMD